MDELSIGLVRYKYSVLYDTTIPSPCCMNDPKVKLVLLFCAWRTASARAHTAGVITWLGSPHNLLMKSVMSASVKTRGAYKIIVALNVACRNICCLNPFVTVKTCFIAVSPLVCNPPHGLSAWLGLKNSEVMFASHQYCEGICVLEIPALYSGDRLWRQFPPSSHPLKLSTRITFVPFNYFPSDAHTFFTCVFTFKFRKLLHEGGQWRWWQLNSRHQPPFLFHSDLIC